jgi:DNA-binding NtrC family response regulator
MNVADRCINPDDDALRVLVVDDEESMRHFLVRALERQDFEVTVVGDGSEALEALAAGAFDVMVTDIRMPGMDGRELFAKARECAPGTLTVLMTAYGSIKDAIAALEQGAESYLAKPFETDEFLATVTKAGEKARLLAENRVLREQLSSAGSFAGLVGQSSAMRKLYRTIDRVARVEGTVLVTGESGAGKELVARAIHGRSGRTAGPFVAAHCGALPETLVEAELFGVVEGAFTGADRSRAGYVERATGGTLFLDEIAEVPLDVQPSLLRFLENGEVTRVGSEEVLHPDVRVVAASNRDLRLLVEEARFRDDLFYRLDVLPVLVPPLRDRTEDIPLLVAHFLVSIGRPELTVPPDVMAYLQGLAWDGNVRELQNLTERLAGTVEGDVVTLEDLPSEVRGGEPASRAGFHPYRLAMEQFEREYLEGLLGRTGGNVSEAARLGGMARPSLHARIAALGIDLAHFRGG